MLKKLELSARDWITDHKKSFIRDKKAKKIVMCKKCRTFYYKHLWRFENPVVVETTPEEEEIRVRFTECPACLEQEEAAYELESNPALNI